MVVHYSDGTEPILEVEAGRAWSRTRLEVLRWVVTLMAGVVMMREGEAGGKPDREGSYAGEFWRGRNQRARRTTPCKQRTASRG